MGAAAGWIRASSDYTSVSHWLSVVMRAAATRTLDEQPAIPAAFSECIQHLLYLESSLAAGTILPSQLTADEAEGLRMKDGIVRELQRSLMRCPRCGAYQDPTTKCRQCASDMGLKREA